MAFSVPQRQVCSSPASGIGQHLKAHLYERVPFEQALVRSAKQVDRGSRSRLVAAWFAAAHYQTRWPMPLLRASSKLIWAFKFRGAWSDPVRHHITVPAQPLDVSIWLQVSCSRIDYRLCRLPAHLFPL